MYRQPAVAVLFFSCRRVPASLSSARVVTSDFSTSRVLPPLRLRQSGGLLPLLRASVAEDGARSTPETSSHSEGAGLPSHRRASDLKCDRQSRSEAIHISDGAAGSKALSAGHSCLAQYAEQHLLLPGRALLRTLQDLAPTFARRKPIERVTTRVAIRMRGKISRTFSASPGRSPKIGRCRNRIDPEPTPRPA